MKRAHPGGPRATRMESDGRPTRPATKKSNRAQKPEKRASRQPFTGVAALFENRVFATELLQAAMRCCDHWKDGPEAREQMRQDVLGTPAHLQADLLDYFQQTYPNTKDNT